jgi:serine/threonine protein phosphatase PrpC
MSIYIFNKHAIYVQAFYGVYDGHGGRAAVDFVADKLGKNVVAALAAAATVTSQHQRPEAASSSTTQPAKTSGDEQVDAVAAAIRAAYLTTDREFLTQVCIIYRPPHTTMPCASSDSYILLASL